MICDLFDQLKCKGNQNFFKKANKFYDSDPNPDTLTDIFNDDSKFIQKTVELQSNQKKKQEQMGKPDNFPTFASTLRTLEFNDWSGFMIRITVMLNSIMGEEYNYTKMLSCPDLDSIEENYGLLFKEQSLFHLFSFNNKRNKKIIHKVLKIEKRKNKTCFRFLMNTSFNVMYAHYKQNCKIMVWENKIYYLFDHLYTPDDNKMVVGEPKKRKKRQKKEPKEKNIKAKKYKNISICK